MKARVFISCGQDKTSDEPDIADSIAKQVLVFQENGVRTLDGIIRFLQANAITFTERAELPDIVRKTVIGANWNAGWRDELSLSRDPKQHANEFHPGNRPVRYWHIGVANSNRYKTAFGCHAYLRSVVRVTEDPESISFELVEYKWRGVPFPSAIIPPNQRREFDAFWMRIDAPDMLIAGTNTDSPRHQMLLKAGKYLLGYSVYSETFAEAKMYCALEFSGTSVESVVLREATPEELEALVAISRA